MMMLRIRAAFFAATTVLALRNAPLSASPAPKLPQRMPSTASATTQPLDATRRTALTAQRMVPAAETPTTRRTALAAAGGCACGCGLYLATSPDATVLDTAQSMWTDASRARDERFARVMSGGMRDYEAWDKVRNFKNELFAHVRQGDDVVEIGIGSAPNLQYYGAKAKRVRAVEPNPAFFDLAAGQAQWEHTKLSVVQGVAEEMPFADSSVDVVVGTMVLCSVQSVRKACEEVKRILKPGGRYLFTEHTRAPDGWRLINTAQAAMDPLQRALANGCHLRRNPLPTIERGFGASSVDARAFVLLNTGRGPPWPPHFLLAPHLVGVARVN